jgi:hypothetical protein
MDPTNINLIFNVYHLVVSASDGVASPLLSVIIVAETLYYLLLTKSDITKVNRSQEPWSLR